LINELCADDEKLWATYNRGKPVTPKQIANRLKAYDIKSKTIRIGYDTAKGFEAEQFADAFSRYLAATPELPVTPSQPIHGGAFAVTDAESVTVTDTLSVTPKPLQHKGCYLVTDKAWKLGKTK
jgi:putative DNA primase/helicase